MSEFPQIQGEYCSWAEITPSVVIRNGPVIQTRDFSSIVWKDSLVPGKIRGTGPYILGRTIGEYDANAAITMYYDQGIHLQACLRDSVPSGLLGVATFNLPVSWTPFSGDGRVHTCVIVGAKIQERDCQNQPGPDGTKIVMPLNVIRIDWYDHFGKLIKFI